MPSQSNRSVFRPIVFSALVLAVLLTAGCAYRDTKWTHPDIPADQWGVDAAQCKWEAREKAEQEAEDKMFAQGDDTFDEGESVDTMLITADIDKRARVLFDRCMSMLGYVSVE